MTKKPQPKTQQSAIQAQLAYRAAMEALLA